MPWIQAAMDSDSSASEAALHKRRERDQDHCDRDSSEEREARLSRRRHYFNEISEVQNFDRYVIMTVINRTQTSV